MPAERPEPGGRPARRERPAHSDGGRRHARIEILLDALAFVGALLVAYAQGFTTKDLAWGFWLSSWTVGSLYLAVGHLWPAVAPVDDWRLKPSPAWRALMILLYLPVLAFALFHFGFFHYIYAFIMDGIIPMVEPPGRVYVGKLTWKMTQGWVPFSIVGLLRTGFARYWPVVAFTVVREGPAIVAGATDLRSVSGKVYGRMLRLHAFIMVLWALYLLGIESFLVFALVFLLYFAPSSLWRRPAASASRAVEQ